VHGDRPVVKLRCIGPASAKRLRGARRLALGLQGNVIHLVALLLLPSVLGCSFNCLGRNIIVPRHDFALRVIQAPDWVLDANRLRIRVVERVAYHSFVVRRIGWPRLGAEETSVSIIGEPGIQNRDSFKITCRQGNFAEPLGLRTDEPCDPPAVSA
jgi:hypothetical protein